MRDLGVIRINDIIQKRDCGLSAEFAGRSVWLSGDTLLATPNEDNRTFLSNSWSSTYDTDAGDGIDGFTERVDGVGAPQEFFPLTEAEMALADAHEGEVCDEGPWSAPVELFSVDAPENVYGWVYDFLAHPEFSQDNGRIIYITYTKKIDRMHSQLRQVAVELDPPR